MKIFSEFLLKPQRDMEIIGIKHFTCTLEFASAHADLQAAHLKLYSGHHSGTKSFIEDPFNE